MKVFYGNLNEKASKNKKYRSVAYTSNLQIVFMNIKPKDEIGKEKHPGVTQLITIVSGRGKAIVGTKKYELKKGITIVIPPNAYHNIINTSGRTNLILTTIYSHPEH